MYVKHRLTCMMAKSKKRSAAAPPLTRSEVMARIRSQDTSPELAVRSYLWTHGVRFRLRQVVEGVRPDLVWKNKRLVIFIDGCFWHGCELHCRRPSSRSSYWTSKIDNNIKRDMLVTQTLQAAGWKVYRFWEHEVATQLEQVGSAIMGALAKCTTL
jgi:DNA mismatch endonuclease (patch repair protein)